MPQIFFNQRSHAERRGVQREPVSVRLDFDPVHRTLIRFADHACDVCFRFGDPARDVADIRHHIFEVVMAFCIKFCGSLVNLVQRDDQHAQCLAGGIPGDLHLIPAGQGPCGGEDAHLPGVIGLRLSFALHAARIRPRC